MGAPVKWICQKCGNTFKASRHHGAFVPPCPKCKSGDVRLAPKK